MPATVFHALTATTPDDPTYEIKPQADWNAAHIVSLGIAGSDLSPAFSNANGISFGTDPTGSYLTASYTTPVQSNQTIGGFAFGNTTINSSTTFDARNFGVSGVGIISVGVIGGNFIISATGGGGGNIVVAAGSNSISSGTAAFGNANNVSFGMAPNGVITASATNQTGIVVGGSNAAQLVSSIVFSNSNGINFGLNGSTITASYTVPNTSGLVSGINVSASGSQLLLASQLSFANSNNLTFGLNGSTVTASFLQTTSPTSVFGIGNTTQTSSGTHSPGSLYLSGAGNISVGVSGNTYILSAVGSAPAGGIALGAGANTTNTGTVVFSNSNGVSFGMNASGVVTATVNPGPAAGMAAVSAGSQLQTTGTLIFSNSNGISFGLSNSSVLTAAYTVPTQSNQPVAVSGSNGSLAFSTLSLGNLNGLSFYTSNGSVVGSYSVPSTAGLISAFNVSAGTAASNETALVFSNSNGVIFGLNGGTVTASVTLGGVSVSAGTSGGALSAMTFSNSNGVSFGINNGVITGSVNTGSQSVQSIGVYAASNTLGTVSTTYDARSLTIAGAGLVSVGNSLGSLFVSGGGLVVSASTNSVSTGSVVFNNANGVSFGMATNGAITASVQPSGLSVSASGSSANLSSLVFSNANGVTFGMSGSTITASAAGGGGSGTQSVQTLGFYAQSNTTVGTSVTFDARSFVMKGLGGISVGNSSNTILVSSPATTVVTLLTAGLSNGIGNTAGATGMTAGQLVFAGGNNVTLSGSTNTSGGMTISVNAAAGGSGGGGNGTLSMYGIGNTTQSSFGTLAESLYSVVGAGMVSVGYSAGQMIISGPATTGVTLLSAGLSNGVGNLAGNTGMASQQLVLAGGPNITLSGSTNGGSMTLSVSAGVGGNVVFSGGTTSNTLSLLSFANSNNVSFGLNGSTLTASVPAITSLSGVGGISVVPSGSTISISYQGVNFSAGSTSNYLNGITFANSNGVSFGLNSNGTITASAAGAPNFSAAGSSANLASLVFSNSNGVSFGLSGSTLTANVNQSLSLFALGNTTQNSTTAINANSVSLNAIGALTVGYSNGSINLSAPATSSIVGVNGVSVSVNLSTISVSYVPAQNNFYQALPANSVQYTQIGNGSVQVYPLANPDPFTASRGDVFISNSVSTSSNSSHAGAISVYMGVYTNNASTLSLASSGSQTYAWSNTSNNSLGTIASYRRLSVPINVNYTGGDVWIALMSQTASTNANWFTASNAVVQWGGSAQLVGLLGQASNNSQQYMPGMGVYSVSSNAMPASMAWSGITGQGSAAQYLPLMNFVNASA